MVAVDWEWRRGATVVAFVGVTSRVHEGSNDRRRLCHGRDTRHASYGTMYGCRGEDGTVGGRVESGYAWSSDGGMSRLGHAAR